MCTIFPQFDLFDRKQRVYEFIFCKTIICAIYYFAGILRLLTMFRLNTLILNISFEFYFF
ncbi:MAG TPA: hypothetical protein DEF07_03065 [Nitrosomonas sp.]|nr:hypothetical protein [Nitrosomonas sp.]